MAKRHRTRARTRRGLEAARRASAPSAPREAVSSPRVPHRPMRGSRTGYARAVGAPSQSLDRAALLERTFVGRDFRRLGLVVAIALVLLVVSGIVEGMLLAN